MKSVHIALTCALLLMACGHKSPEQACASLANARCSKLNTCSAGNGVARTYGSMDDCMSRIASQCMTRLAALNTSLTSDFEEGCGAAVSEQSCGEFRAGIVAPRCLPPSGKLTKGSACVIDAQCGSTVCLKPSTSECGMCSDQPVDGDSCINAAGCGRQLACVALTTCRVAGQTGAGCDPEHPCAGGFACVTSDANATNGLCQTVAESGNTCDAQAVSAPYCDSLAGLFCNPQTRQCAAATLVAPDGVCSPGAGGVCAQGAECQSQSSVASGADRLCIAPSPEGVACDTINGPPCKALARCVLTTAGGTQGICALPSLTACGT